MASPPPCQALGPQCRSLPVTLRVASLEDGSESVDHEATWLLGHAGHIVFGPLHRDDRALFVEARLEVGCRYLLEAAGQARSYSRMISTRRSASRSWARDRHSSRSPLMSVAVRLSSGERP